MWSRESVALGATCATLAGLFIAFLATSGNLQCTEPPSAIPREWRAGVERGDILYAPSYPDDDTLLPEVGNGYLGYKVGSDSIFVGGLYNGPADAYWLVSHRARIPSPFSIRVLGAEPYRAALDARHGFYSQSWWACNGTDSHYAVHQRWYAHRAHRHLLVMEMNITTSGDRAATVRFASRVGVPSADIGFTLTYANEVLHMNGSTSVPERPGGHTPTVAAVGDVVPAQVYVPPRTTVRRVFVLALATNIPGDTGTATGTTAPLDVARAQYLAARESSYGTLVYEHMRAWDAVWAGGVEIGGHVALARAVNTSLYYLHSSAREDWPWSLSPGGLASNAYNGHVFWDATVWMEAPLLVLRPSIAHAMLEYRHVTRPGAEEKARVMGYNGTMFAWESAYTGVEACPTFAPTGLLEQHITADVCLALRQYWYATYDMNWLLDRGFPLLDGMATFWLSRVERHTDASGAHYWYDINGVIPPDEYATGVNNTGVDNSAFTNAAVSLCLQFAIEAAPYVGVFPPAAWRDVVQHLVVPFDRDLDIHLEYDGYDGATIKQADVVMMAYPLGWGMTRKVRRSDLEYYEPRTDVNGPAMTYGMHAVGWLSLGDVDKAADLFERAYANAHAPFDVWYETPEGGAVNFITGAGGFLQAVLNGYGGMRLRDEAAGMRFAPVLPPGADSFTLRNVVYLGQRFSVHARDGEHTRVSTGEHASALCVTWGDECRLLTASSPVDVPSDQSQFWVRRAL